jgi:hypothetical protein
MARRIKIESKSNAQIEYTYKTSINYKCPKRGLITQIVEVKRYKTPELIEESKFSILEDLGILEEYRDDADYSDIND